MTSLNNGLVHLKKQQNVDDMLERTKGVREIGVYVTHPSRKLVKSWILGWYPMQVQWGEDDNVVGNVEDRVEGMEVEGDVVTDVSVVAQIDDVERVEVPGVEVEGGVVDDDVERVEVPGVEVEGGPELEGVDEFMENNNVVYDRSEDIDHDDYDFETEIFMREDDYNYSNEEEMEGSDMDDDASIGNEREACYINEDEALEDMRPLLNEIGPLPKDVFEHYDQLVELSGEEEEVSSSSRKPKRSAGLEFNKAMHLKHPILVTGIIFGNASDFSSLIREYALRTKNPLKFVKNDRSRVRVKCLQEGCGFSIFCSKIGKTNDLAIKTLVEEHTCGPPLQY
ncbi:hypothetical protein LIER_37205 [Lithospermum erythrorhizon]|uniref:Transposase MuDR plant domain-containing protein n=1 Tax=Lithospermum erythrorhizon TaxID=34254 RepID=A0AAV3PGU2_LITER